MTLTWINPKQAQVWCALIGLFAGILFGMYAAFAFSAETAEKLKQGGFVIVMRHALTDGLGDPENFSLKDCKTQRNLNAKGKEQAAELARKLDRAQIKITRILSSPWCRCVDTARLVAPGLGVEKRSELGSFLNVSQNDRKPQIAEIHEEIEAWKGPGNLLIVSHQINIIDLLDENIPQGAFVVVEPKGRKVVTVEQ